MNMSSEKNNKKKNEEKIVPVKTITKKETNNNKTINKTPKVTQKQKEINNNNTNKANKKPTNQTRTNSTKKENTSTNNKEKKNNTVKHNKNSKVKISQQTNTKKNKKNTKKNTKQTNNNKKTLKTKNINNNKISNKNKNSKKVTPQKTHKKTIITEKKDTFEKNKDHLVVDIKEKKESKPTKKNIQSKNKLNYISFSIIGIISITLIITFVLSFFINKNIIINLKGNQNETIEVYTDYKDAGWNATLFKKNINKYIKTTSNLNTNKLGTYQIKYRLPFINTHKTTRTITVVDTQAPEIKLNGDETITIYVDNDYIEYGVTITDNYDTNLFRNLIIEHNIDINTKGTYKVKYTVKDSSNNEASITRKVIVKNKPANSKTCNTTNPISKYICENNYKVSVGYYNLNTQETYYYNKYEQYYGASLIKTLDALYLYDKNMINDKLKKHVKKIITVSDNPSHEYLVKYIGKNTLKAYGNSLGAKYTLVGGDSFGITTVSDQIVYMQKLYSMTNNTQNEELKSFFINSYYNNLLFDNCPTIMHKYGWWKEVFHNSGIVLDENPYIVTILTKEAYNDYNEIISTISKLVYEYHKTL